MMVGPELCAPGLLSLKSAPYLNAPGLKDEVLRWKGGCCFKPAFCTGDSLFYIWLGVIPVGDFSQRF
jgi:hypothetical protein